MADSLIERMIWTTSWSSHEGHRNREMGAPGKSKRGPLMIAKVCHYCKRGQPAAYCCLTWGDWSSFTSPFLPFTGDADFPLKSSLVPLTLVGPRVGLVDLSLSEAAMAVWSSPGHECESEVPGLGLLVLWRDRVRPRGGVASAERLAVPEVRLRGLRQHARPGGTLALWSAIRPHWVNEA